MLYLCGVFLSHVEKDNKSQVTFCDSAQDITCNKIILVILINSLRIRN